MSMRVDSHRIIAMVRRIVRQIRRDRRTLGLMIAAPLLVTFLWSFIFAGTVTNVPTAVCIQDEPLEDSLGATVSSLLETNANVSVFNRLPADAFDGFGASIQAALLLPPDLTQGILRGENVTIGLHINVTTELQANYVLGVIANVTSHAAIDMFGSRGLQMESNITFVVPLPAIPLDLSFNLSLVNEDLGFPDTIGAIFGQILSDNGNVSVITCDNRTAVVDSLRSQVALAGVYISTDFTRATLDGENPPIELFVNGIQYAEAAAALAAVQDSLTKAVARALGRESEAQANVTYVYGEAGMSMIEVTGPGIIGFMSMFFGFLISGVFFLRERQQGTLERMRSTPMGDLEIVLGYSIAFVGVSIVQTTLISGVILYLSPTLLSSILQVVPLVLLLAIGSVTLAIAASYRMKNELQIMQMIPMFIIPQMFLSGLLFPLSALPSYLAWLPYFFPLTYYVMAVRSLAFFNATLLDVIVPTIVLVVYCLLGIALSIARRSEK